MRDCIVHCRGVSGLGHGGAMLWKRCPLPASQVQLPVLRTVAQCHRWMGPNLRCHCRPFPLLLPPLLALPLRRRHCCHCRPSHSPSPCPSPAALPRPAGTVASAPPLPLPSLTFPAPPPTPPPPLPSLPSASPPLPSLPGPLPLPFLPVQPLILPRARPKRCLAGLRVSFCFSFWQRGAGEGAEQNEKQNENKTKNTEHRLGQASSPDSSCWPRATLEDTPIRLTKFMGRIQAL